MRQIPHCLPIRVFLQIGMNVREIESDLGGLPQILFQAIHRH